MTGYSDDNVTLTPWEEATVARMEEEIGLHGPGSPGRRRRPAPEPGPVPIVGGAIAAFGTVAAFTGGPFLGLAGWILFVIGMVTVWESL